MAFTMSYGATPPPTPTETPPKATAPKTPVPYRGRRHGDLRAQAQAVFDPALAQTFEAPPPSAAMDVPEDVPEDGAAPPTLAERVAPAPGAHGLPPA
jgi:hypothetical protein